jgi:ABC-2 type transport system permease protein
MRRALSNILAVAYREVVVLRHDKGFLTTVMAQPVILLLLYSYGISYTPANVPWAVLDRSDSVASRRLVADIRTTGYFKAPVAVTSYDEGRGMLRSGAVLALLVVPHDFSRDLRGAAPRSAPGGRHRSDRRPRAQYVSQVASRFDAGRAPPARETDPARRTGGPIDVRQRFWFNATLADRDFFLAILAGMLLSNICLSGVSLGIVGERESGTFEQTLSLPISPLQIVMGKLLPLVAVGYGLLGFTILGSGVLFGL